MMDITKLIRAVGMIVSLLFAVIEVEGGRFNLYRVEYLDYQENCNMKSIKRQCNDHFGLVCDPLERKCLCRPGEILKEPCDYNFYFRRYCWRQCVGRPGQNCSPDYRIDGKVNKRYCVEGAHCIQVTESSRKSSVVNNVCICKRGFNISNDGTRCAPLILTGRSVTFNASGLIGSMSRMQGRSKCWVLCATWKITLALCVISLVRL